MKEFPENYDPSGLVATFIFLVLSLILVNTCTALGQVKPKQQDSLKQWNKIEYVEFLNCADTASEDKRIRRMVRRLRYEALQNQNPDLKLNDKADKTPWIITVFFIIAAGALYAFNN